MDTFPRPEWHEALQQMETALQTVEKSLNRWEERYELALAPSAGEGELPAAGVLRENLWDAWISRLADTERIVHEAEGPWNEATNALKSWRKRFADWQQLLQQQQTDSAK
ncbi:MAG: hypothetical protein RMJ56_03245 [Gemmataceae bacterium]|nr:hypothetical protein [Gemmata sp.]MDW8196604.1 hypothetical protein [Gemmataceae bacterium]